MRYMTERKSFTKKRIMKRKVVSCLLSMLLVLSILKPGFISNAASGWNSDSYGWYYVTGDSYYAGQWAEIGGYWYYFTADGYMDYSEYRDGCWLQSDGVWNTAYSNGQWKVNSTGWWFEDGGWYAVGQWLWINGSCYHFDDSGYMEYNCYRDGCWITASGAWDTSSSSGKWASDSAGWWYEDNGWYPKNQGLWIDGAYYWFGDDGYWDEAETEKKRASGNDGRNSSSGGNGASGGGNSSGGRGDGAAKLVYGDYYYKIIPMLEPFNEYFYIETDNPDPDSFSFVDESTVYGDNGSGSIEPVTTVFSDVTYENTNTLRVKGGYIFAGSYTDGGTIRLKARTVVGEYPVYNITTGETTYKKEYEDQLTDATVDIGKLVDEADYLIQTYSGDAADFFGKLSNIQSGFSSICLYSGASIRGVLYKSTTSPYYGISNSPHIDQGLYIQSPYGRKGGKGLLVSYLYPFRYDSLGFPGMMGRIATRLDASATYKWNSNSHWLIDVTYNGTTKSYGGQGNGGGQPITQDKVNYWFTFDRSSNDAYMNASLSGLKSQLSYYGSLTIPDDTPTTDKLTAAIIRKTVGEGKYARIVGINSVYGSTNSTFTYLYDNGATSEGVSYNINVGRFSNAWYDGRYFNRFEAFEKGTKFGQNSQKDTQTNTGKSAIIIKDAVIKVPDNGKTYYYNYSKGLPSNYNASTGKWSGYTRYSYDSASGNWIAEQYNSLKYYEGGYKTLVDETFVDACTLTPAEVSAMGVDRNADVDPASFLIYDMKTAPGTPGSSGN